MPVPLLQIEELIAQKERVRELDLLALMGHAIDVSDGRIIRLFTGVYPSPFGIVDIVTGASLIFEHGRPVQEKGWRQMMEHHFDQLGMDTALKMTGQASDDPIEAQLRCTFLMEISVSDSEDKEHNAAVIESFFFHGSNRLETMFRAWLSILPSLDFQISGPHGMDRPLIR